MTETETPPRIAPTPPLHSTMTLRCILLCLSLLGSPSGTPAQTSSKQGAGLEPAKAGKPDPAALLPQSPSELYAKLSEATRPQWRQHYRATVTRCLEGRQQAAMGLGAVIADLFLAAQARDSQQVRNLLQDEETIEKTLGLVASMATLRTEVLGASEQADWPRLMLGIEKLSAGQRRNLCAQKDEPLAELAYIGQWLRTFQTCHAVVINREVKEHQLAVGDPALIAEMIRRLNTLSHAGTETNRCLRLLHKRLAGLSRLWPLEGAVVRDPADRLRRSAVLLDDAVGQLIQDEEPAASGTIAAPRIAPP